MLKKSSIISVFVLCLAPITFGDESVKPAEAPHTPKSTAEPDQALLDDLARIRQQMGGSVLNGSLLDSAVDDNSDAAFHNGVQALIEQSAKRELLPGPTFEEVGRHEPAQRSPVKTLREQCVRLDRVANDLEALKQYVHADELRESARVLRLLAREMDEPRINELESLTPMAPATSVIIPDEPAEDPFRDGRYIRVRDGRLMLHGTYASLAGIQAISKGGHLSLETFVIPGFGGQPMANPFNQGDGMVVKNTATDIVIGVLGHDRRIDVSGEVVTSILYSESEEVAANGDLIVRLGLGNDPPTEIRVGGAPAKERPPVRN